MEHRPAGRVFTDYFCPLEAGYKDRSGVLPYDRAAARAISATYTPPLQGAAEGGRSLFVSRLPRDAEEADLEKVFTRFGALQEIRLIRDLVTGAPRGYGFVVFARRRDAAAASAACRRLCVLGADVVVERDLSHTLPGWKPRRLGGGLGGRKESGQLRFGGSARPFQLNPAAHTQTRSAPISHRHSWGPADTGRESDPRERTRGPTEDWQRGPEQGPELGTHCDGQTQSRRDSERYGRNMDWSRRDSGRRREGDGDPDRSEKSPSGAHFSQSVRHRSSDRRRTGESSSRARDSTSDAAEGQGHRKERRKSHKDKDREGGKRRGREEEDKGGRHHRDREHRRHRRERGSPHR